MMVGFEFFVSPIPSTSYVLCLRFVYTYTMSIPMINIVSGALCHSHFLSMNFDIHSFSTLSYLSFCHEAASNTITLDELVHVASEPCSQLQKIISSSPRDEEASG